MKLNLTAEQEAQLLRIAQEAGKTPSQLLYERALLLFGDKDTPPPPKNKLERP
jgi:hypothetical protein